MLIPLKRNILGLITRIDVKTGFIVNSLVRPRNVTPVFGTVSSDSWQARRYINNLVFGTVSTDSWQPRRYINNRARQAGRVRTHLNTAPWCTRAQCADMCAYVTGTCRRCSPRIPPAMTGTPPARPPRLHAHTFLCCAVLCAVLTHTAVSSRKQVVRLWVDLVACAK